MKHGSLFSGIGGFDLAAEWMGWENIFHCEWNEFGQKVLKHYWPKAISYGDITKTDFTIHRGGIDILTGGFPCQPYSSAGKRLGKEDDRHLWPSMLRAISEIKPRWIVGENVRGLINWNGGMVFDEVQADLEAEGYEVLPFLLPACAVNAPHRRDRIWFVAHNSDGIKFGSEPRVCERPDAVTVGIRKGTTPDAAHKEQREQAIEGLRPEFGSASHGTTQDANGSGGKEPKQQQSNLPTKSGRCNTETTANAQRGGRESRAEERVQPEIPVCEGAFNTCECRLTPNPNGSIRCKGGMHSPRCETAERYTGSCNARSHERPTWDNFPTQPPVCSGNDGLSSRLVGITIPKHRNESIKAYGNAVVPQVVYQIFQAINAIEQP